MGVSMFISIIGTIIVLILTIVTITEGYGYKHIIDELPSEHDNDNEEEESQKQSWG